MDSGRPETSQDEPGRQLLQPGDVVDRYEVEAVIGAGGTAMVYRVRHRELGNAYAMKVLALVSAAIRRRTMQEARLQATLRHRNIVGVYDVLDVHGAPGLLMEYVKGPTLELALERHRFSVPDAETLFRGILAGVREAHRKGMVHRDLKPANVLLSQTPEGIAPKVTDFGIAKVIEGDGAAKGATRAGIAMGTPQYMAPEQIRDAKGVDRRADIFSLGCILYELVTGVRAFPQDDILAVYNAVADGDVIPAHELADDVPRRILNAIDGALTVERTDRIPDTDTLAQVFEGRMAWPPGTTIPDPSEVGDDDDVTDAPRDHLPAELLAVLAQPDDLGVEDLRTDASGIGTLNASAATRMSVDRMGEADNEPSIAIIATSQRKWRARTVVLAGMLLVSYAAFFSWALKKAEPVAPVPVVEPMPSAVPDALARPALVPSILHDVPDMGSDPPARVAPAPRSRPKPRPRPAVEPTPAPTPAPEPVAEPDPEPEPEPVAETPAAYTVRLLSKPPTASMWIDGTSAGRTPRKVDLAPGPHSVRMTVGEAHTTFSIDVAGASENKWCFQFDTKTLHTGSCPR